MLTTEVASAKSLLVFFGGLLALSKLFLLYMPFFFNVWEINDDDDDGGEFHAITS